MKTSELTGLALDWAVTTIETPEALRFGLEDWIEQRRAHTRFGEYLHRWSTSWSWAGPIIEREDICINRDDSSREWSAHRVGDEFGAYWGPTPLIAAMRAYVSSKLGKHVDVPLELVA
jgi:hypothetical protein